MLNVRALWRDLWLLEGTFHYGGRQSGFSFFFCIRRMNAKRFAGVNGSSFGDRKNVTLLQAKYLNVGVKCLRRYKRGSSVSAYSLVLTTFR